VAAQLLIRRGTVAAAALSPEHVAFVPNGTSHG